MFESKISFSKEHIISEIEVIILVESIKLSNQIVKIFCFFIK